MKLLPLTTREQLPNPHRASHQVSKSTHLCTITREDNKWCEAPPELAAAAAAAAGPAQPHAGHSKGAAAAASAVLTCQ